MLADPCCGTGTILIEAAWMAANRAPGLGRGFLAEEWPRLAGPSGEGAWKNARQEADDLVVEPPEVPLLGGDRNPKALDLAKRNAEQAGVTAAIAFEQVAVADFGSHHKYGCVVTNPPYGERMGEKRRPRRSTVTWAGWLAGWTPGACTRCRLTRGSRRSSRRHRAEPDRCDGGSCTTARSSAPITSMPDRVRPGCDPGRRNSDRAFESVDCLP